MEVMHTTCGGTIDQKTKKCSKCKKKWSSLSFFFSTEIRAIPGTLFTPQISDPVENKSWGKKLEDRVPGAGVLPKLLPNWPRGLRLLSVTVVLGLIVLGVSQC